MYMLFKTETPDGKLLDAYGPFDSEEMAGEFRDEFFDDSESVYVIELICPYFVYRETFK